MALSDLIQTDIYDQEQLERVISPYIRFSPSNLPVIRPLIPWRGLNAEKKILMFLIAERTRELLSDQLPQRGDPLTPQALKNELNVPGGTLRPKLKSLRERGFVSVTEEGVYSFELSMISEAEEFIAGESGVNKDGK